MSREDYLLSRELAAMVDDAHYYALIMAAIRSADSDNLRKIRHAWPEVYEEFNQRYHAPASLLPGETDEANGIARLADGRLVALDSPRAQEGRCTAR